MNQRHKEAERKEKLIFSAGHEARIRTAIVSLFVLGFMLMSAPHLTFAQGVNAATTTNASTRTSASSKSPTVSSKHYTDGTTATYSLSFTDWCASPAKFGNLVVATANYRHTANGNQSIKTSIYYTDVALAAGKTIQSVTLPNNANIHIFSIGTK